MTTTKPNPWLLFVLLAGCATERESKGNAAPAVISGRYWIRDDGSRIPAGSCEEAIKRIEALEERNRYDDAAPARAECAKKLVALKAAGESIGARECCGHGWQCDRYGVLEKPDLDTCWCGQ